MHKNQLRELIRDGDFITGVYNYCDRWCERCPLTTRCLVYASERADQASSDPEAHDINSAKFWERLETRFQEAHEMILEWAKEAGVDLAAIDAVMDRDEQEQTAGQHELSLAAHGYAEMVRQWFIEEFAVEQDVHIDTTGATENTGEDINVNDAIEVIRWYQFFIAAKLFRALIGSEDDAADDALMKDLTFAGTESDAGEDDSIPDPNNDSDGSAKIALIAIDRSLSAWRVMQSSFPEKAESILVMQIELERLRRAAEQIFPHAWDFIRPGFDEVISDFVS